MEGNLGKEVEAFKGWLQSLDDRACKAREINGHVRQLERDSGLKKALHLIIVEMGLANTPLFVTVLKLSGPKPICLITLHDTYWIASEVSEDHDKGGGIRLKADEIRYTKGEIKLNPGLTCFYLEKR